MMRSEEHTHTHTHTHRYKDTDALRDADVVHAYATCFATEDGLTLSKLSKVFGRVLRVRVCVRVRLCVCWCVCVCA